MKELDSVTFGTSLASTCRCRKQDLFAAHSRAHDNAATILEPMNHITGDQIGPDYRACLKQGAANQPKRFVAGSLAKL
jgi:hypothetical protein